MDIPTPIPAQPTRFLDKVRSYIRLRGMAYKTEKTYLFWIKRFIRFHGLQHPEGMGSAEVEAFLSHLVLQANVSIATQRVALNALVFLYREFLGQPLDELSFERSRKAVKTGLHYCRIGLSHLCDSKLIRHCTSIKRIS